MSTTPIAKSPRAAAICSFTSINLPRIAIEANGNVDVFFKVLQERMELVIDQLNERFRIISNKRVKNFPFLMGEGVWIDSEKLSWNDKVGEVLKHGTMTIGFIGLAEALVALRGKHHGEDEESQKLGLKIIRTMREYTDKVSAETGLNYSVIATPAEGLSGRFVRMDRARYGSIEGVTDRDYYTNGFHVPVYYDISAFDKIEIEAPYHALTNAGHISYVELDGDPSENLEAFEAVIRHMKDSGYRSYHLIVYYTVETMNGRSASRWKSRSARWRWISGRRLSTRCSTNIKANIPDHIRERLSAAAKAIIVLDNEMSSVRSEIMDAQNSSQMQRNLITDILNNIENLYKVTNKREVEKIQDEFYHIYAQNDLQELKRFHKELDLIAEGYRAQAITDEL